MGHCSESVKPHNSQIMPHKFGMFAESRLADILHHPVTLVEAQDHGVGPSHGCSPMAAATGKTTPLLS